MPDDDGVPVARGDLRHHELAVLLAEIVSRRYQDVRGGVEPQVLVAPLLREVVGHHEHGLAMEAEPLSLLGGGDHLVGLSGADGMRDERVAAEHHAGHGVLLMRPELDIGAHLIGKSQPRPVEPARHDRVEELVVIALDCGSRGIVGAPPAVPGVFECLRREARLLGFDLVELLCFLPRSIRLRA